MSFAADQRRWPVQTLGFFLPALLMCSSFEPLQSAAAESQVPAA
jgi:hypothetical protein